MYPGALGGIPGVPLTIVSGHLWSATPAGVGLQFLLTNGEFLKIPGNLVNTGLGGFEDLLSILFIAILRVQIKSIPHRLKMPIPYNPTKVSGKLVARENELKVLRALHLFGHLRRIEVAQFVWPFSSLASSKIMCSTTVKRMIDARLILERPNSLGGKSLVLGSAGAAALQNEGIESDAGYDLTSVTGPQFWHRTLGTSFLVNKASQGVLAYGEHFLAREKGALNRLSLIKTFEKAPDGLLLRPHGVNASWVDWVEVESSAKDNSEIFKMFNILNFTHGKPFGESKSYKVGKLYIVYDVRQPHERTLTSALQRYLVENQGKIQPHFLDHIVFVRSDLDFPLIVNGFEELTIKQILPN